MMARINPHVIVHYLEPAARAEAYLLAHRLSVEGRGRDAPETISPAGLEVAAERPGLSKAQRKQKGAGLLLEHAQLDPSFNGDFTAIAERLGWTSGPRWRDNPAIQIAAARWKKG